MGTIVVAFGGNALQPPEQGTADHYMDLSSAAGAIADVVEEGHRLVITHGNGPQVGHGLLRNVWAPPEVPRLSMASLVAQSQGELGALLSLALANTFYDRRIDVPVVSLVTHVEVDPQDVSLSRATKPVGPVLTDPSAIDSAKAKTGLAVMPERGGYRMAVPSPVPQRVVEWETVNALIDQGAVVIAGGGGGIPVVRNADGRLEAVIGVVDKDRTSALLATSLNADTLVFLTDVEGVYRDFGTPEMTLITEGTWQDFDRMVRDPSASGVGSMKPKMDAACGFVRATQKPAAIGKLEDAARVVSGHAGTRIVWESRGGRQNAQ